MIFFINFQFSPMVKLIFFLNKSYLLSHMLKTEPSELDWLKEYKLDLHQDIKLN